MPSDVFHPVAIGDDGAPTIVLRNAMTRMPKKKQEEKIQRECCHGVHLRAGPRLPGAKLPDVIDGGVSAGGEGQCRDPNQWFSITLFEVTN
ncbi:hypothetical protein ACLOJK_022679 [Asimina triloba]